jgi:hypothetical protein
MRRLSFTSFASLALCVSLALAGCAGDDNTVPPPVADSGSDATAPSSDGGVDGSSQADASLDSSQTDAPPDATQRDASPDADATPDSGQDAAVDAAEDAPPEQ